MRKLLVAVCMAALVLPACKGYNNARGRGDAPVGPVDSAEARIVEFPDLFANIAFKCIGPNGIYVTTRDAAPAIVANDPLCGAG